VAEAADVEPEQNSVSDVEDSANGVSDEPDAEPVESPEEQSVS
jgi:hypothetical protein